MPNLQILRPVAVLVLPLLLAACGGAGAESPPPASETASAAAPQAAPVRRMAVTVDDLPVAPPDRHVTATQGRITEELLAVLAAHRVPAIGFVNEKKLEVDGRVEAERVALLERWLKAGFELGNHTWSHPDLHRVSLEEFQTDLVRGESVTRRLLAERGRELRYFRHPFLHTGRDLETKRALEGFLAERGYRVAPVTVDNSEWIYGGAYARAFERGDEEAMARLGTDYVAYMERVVEFYEGQSRALFEREIPQVLLIHAYALNARHLDALLTRLEARGYRWIPLDEALEDPAYDSPDTYTGPGGITWLHRWALTRGVDRSLFAGEPEVPEWVSAAAGVDSP